MSDVYRIFQIPRFESSKKLLRCSRYLFFNFYFKGDHSRTTQNVFLLFLEPYNYSLETVTEPYIAREFVGFCVTKGGEGVKIAKIRVT